MNLNRNLKISIGIVVLGVLAAAGFLAYVKYFKKPASLPTITILPEGINQDNSATSTLTYGSQADTMIAGFKLYKSSEFGFEIQYPATWTVSEEDIVNVRGENTKAFYFKKPGSDLRFAILPRDGLSYGLPENGTSSPVFLGGSQGMQTQYTLSDVVAFGYLILNMDFPIGRKTLAE